MNQLPNRLCALLTPVLTAGLMSAMSITPAAAAPTVYKWVDEKGVVNYTTTPPPAQRKAAVIDVAPAVAGRGVLLDYDDMRYSHARDARDTADEMELGRMRRSAGQLRPTGTQIDAAAYARESRTQTARAQAVDRCRSQRHVDCDTNPYPAGSTLDPSWLYPYRPIVVVRRPLVVTPPARP